MPNNDAPTSRTIDWAALARKAWGAEFTEPEPVYKFSNGREFKDSESNGGPYDQS